MEKILICGRHIFSGMAIDGSFLLPMGLILATSLITQMEFRNNTWKQLHTTPQKYSTIFTAKFIVIIGLTLQFLFISISHLFYPASFRR